MNATTISRISKDSTNPTSPPAEQLQETPVVERLREHSFNRAGS